MKKRWLPLVLLFCFCVCFIGGCKDENNSVVDKLNIDGKDIILKVGDKTYSADELFSDMLNSGVGVQSAYSKILEMVVESSVEVDSNMEASWELKLDAFEEEVATYASSNGVSEDEARTQLLSDEGYSSVEEMKNAYYYEVKLDKVQDMYWEEKKDEYYDAYFEARLPYYVKHVLVKTSYNSTRGMYATTIDSSDAKALHKVYDMLVNGYKFSYIMNQVSEDTGSKDTGLGYHMDLTTSFVSEFLHGVFVFDALLKNQTSEVIGLTNDVLSLYSSSTTGYNFGVINASDIEALGDSSESSSYEDIRMYEGDDTESKDTIYNAYGYNSLYSRSIIFNQTFNNPGISVIAYDLDEDAPENVVSININGVSKNVLTDENGNIVFVVCARGSSSDLWIHFLTVNVSPFDTNAKLFFSMDQDSMIEKMVEEKRKVLVNEGKSEDEINTEITAYKNELEQYKTYVDLKGGEKQTDRNDVIDELEEIVKTYAKRGITSGEVAGEDQFISYDMVEYFMEKGNIVIVNEDVKKAVESYIAAQKELIDLKSMNSIVEGWSEYYKLVSLAHSEEIISRKIPMECSVVANGDGKSLCKYSYENGFEIMLEYDENDGTMPAEYVESYHIGDSAFELAVPTRENYTFDGWYSTSDYKEGTKVVSIDTSRSSTKNKIVLYAKWIENVE